MTDKHDSSGHELARRDEPSDILDHLLAPSVRMTRGTVAAAITVTEAVCLVVAAAR
jgi:hypothetical protein